MRWTRSTRHRTLPGWAHCDQYRAAVNGIVQALNETVPALPGVRVEQAGHDPREPEFYVATTRIPGDDRQGLKPVTLFHLLSPDWLAREPAGEIIFIAAIGHAAASISARRFLRTWGQGRIGGEVIYDGDLEQDSLRAHAAEALARFLEQRTEVTTKDNLSGTISVWPLAADFRPRLCTICLLPAAQGVCPKCGIPTLPGRPRRRSPR